VLVLDICFFRVDAWANITMGGAVASTPLAAGSTSALPVDGEDAAYSVRKRALAPGSVADTHTDIEAQSKPLMGFHVTGPCPGCTHKTSDVFPATTIVMGSIAGSAGGDAGRGRIVTVDRIAIRPFIGTSAGMRRINVRRHVGDVEKPKVAMLRCRCDVSHTSSNGKDGCGATWLIKASFDNGNPAGGARLEGLTADEAVAAWPSAEAMASSAAASLKTVQGAAAKWQTALTSVLALIGVVSLVGGRSVLETISPDRQWVIVGLAAVAVLANAWAIYQSALSNIGFPRIRQAVETPELIDSDLWPLRQAAHSTAKLHAAVFWAAFSFLAAIIAIGFVWMSPDTQASAITLTLVNQDAGVTSVCGSLQTSNPSDSSIRSVDNISLLLKDGIVKSYPLSNIKEVKPGGC
jgi:hypothetical protein